ncbi:HET domain-containing protein [Mycena sanguinolenta]|uniref:HET domain-containing protein n=1 Tax=Mycena sanguinolenta TaxID=230812 RepID=A0A8H7DFU4_9AGAR|nr:HET domain-containing protein [Mycena sanguinolenta]
MNALTKSFSAMRTNMRVGRLFQEDDHVAGCGFFHRRPEMPLHILGNILRLIFIIVLAPLYLLIPRVVYVAIGSYMRSNWLLEYATTPDSVLSTARGGGKGQYDMREFQPKWVLEVTILNGELHSFHQIPYSEEVAEIGYIAISYPFKSAVVLATEADFVPGPAPEGHDYSRRDKRSMIVYLLRLYCGATRRDGNPDRTEYIWLDEFCISDLSLSDDIEKDKAVIKAQRDAELAKLADVFRCAAQVAVFCHEPNCDHTSLSCIWGQRLYTLSEILHVETVLRLTRWLKEEKLAPRISRITGRSFREAMQKHAAEGNRWHLNAIYQHSVNSGAVPWQVAIHALVVEAIRRDEAGGFRDHKLLGKALNGLLPRRARPVDLGSGGWNDLAWLLELNQGFYNAASLAAVCCISEDNSVSWLGKPIDPVVGNERLEPVVTAFPVASGSHPPLTIVGGETVGFRPIPLKRDSLGLYNNEEMRGAKILAISTAMILALIGTLVLGSGDIGSAFLIYYLTTIAYCIFELLIGTMYLVRDGWVFLEDSLWGDKLEAKLGEQDNNLRKLTHWGDRQLVPKWEVPGVRPSFTARLVDLRSKVCVQTIVVSRPNAMIPLAIHGSGVTCMLLDRAEDSKVEINLTAQKVGMCNVPPYIFSQTVKSGTTYVGVDPAGYSWKRGDMDAPAPGRRFETREQPHHPDSRKRKR